MASSNRIKRTIPTILLTFILAVLAWLPTARAQSPQPPLAQEQILVVGAALHPNPPSQTVPKNTGTGVNPGLVRADQAGGELPPLPDDALVVAELRGPAYNIPIPLSA